MTATDAWADATTVLGVLEGATIPAPIDIYLVRKSPSVHAAYVLVSGRLEPITPADLVTPGEYLDRFGLAAIRAAVGRNLRWVTRGDLAGFRVPSGRQASDVADRIMRHVHGPSSHAGAATYRAVLL